MPAPRYRTDSNRPWWLVAIIAALLGGIVAAEDYGFGPTVTPAGLIGDHLVRLSRLVLAADQGARTDQVVRAKILLDLARQLQPNDAEILLLSAEVAQLIGDQPAYREALSRYCRQQPGDDAAQWQLIMALLAQHDSLETRVAAMTALLANAGAERYSVSLRSRLASYLAAVALEAGDHAAALAKVKQALKLDTSNVQAATIAYDVATARQASPEALGTALLLLVRTDPLNAAWRIKLADLLLAQGAYVAAAEQYSVAENLGAAPSVAVVERWRQVHARAPGTPTSMQAAVDLATASAATTPHPLGKRLSVSIAAWKQMIRSPNPTRRPWLSVKVDLGQATRFAYLDPIEVQVQLANATDLPLAIGPRQTLRSTVLLLTAVQMQDDTRFDLPPLVVDLGRRLRLEPGQRLELPVRLDRGALGSLLAERPSQHCRIIVTAVLDPALTADGNLTAGRLGGADVARSLERRGLSPTEANINGWLATLSDSAAAIEKLKVLARLVQLADAAADPALAARIVDEVNQSWPKLDRHGQALLLGLMPADAQSQARWPALYAWGKASDDPLIRICYLTRHAADDAAAISAAMQCKNDQIANYARAMQRARRRSQE